MDFTTWRGKAGSALTRLQGSVHKTVKGWYRVKDFIRLVRKAATKAEERALMAKESARIRTALKSPDCQSDERWHGLAKLLFMHLHCNGLALASVLPDPNNNQHQHNHQHHQHNYQQQAIEFMKVVAAASATGGSVAGLTRGRSRLGVKRLGYFGATLLLAADPDNQRRHGPGHAITLLLTNTLKQDLEHGDSAAVQCSALSCLAALPNPEMYFELAQPVITLAFSPDGNKQTSQRAAVCLSVMVARDSAIWEMIPEGAVERLMLQSDEGDQLAAAYLASASGTGSTADKATSHRLANMLVRQLRATDTAILTVSRLQALTSLACGEPEIVEQLRLFIGALPIADAGKQSYSQYGVLMESLRTLSLLSHDESTVQLVADRIGDVLVTAGHDPNIKLVALECLYGLTATSTKTHATNTKTHATNTKTHATTRAIAKHRAAILQCIRPDTDPLIVRLAVQLALAIVIDRKTLSLVLDHVLANVPGESLSPNDRHIIGHRMVSLLLVHGGTGEDFLPRALKVLDQYYRDAVTEEAAREAIVKLITDRLLFTSMVPKPVDEYVSVAALEVIVWLEGRHARSTDRLHAIIDMGRMWNDEIVCGHVLMACERLAAKGIDVDDLINRLFTLSDNRAVKEQCLFTAAVLRQTPSDVLLTVEPDLMADADDTSPSAPVVVGRETSGDSRGRIVFTGTGLTVYMRRLPSADSASASASDASAGTADTGDSVVIQATMVNPIQHAAQPTANVSLQVAVQKGLTVSIGTPTGGPSLPPFSAHPITQDITVSGGAGGVGADVVRLRVRVRYGPAAAGGEELFDTFDVSL